MDYHSTIADDESPAGPSPWGSTPPVSPRRNQTGYSTSGTEPAYQYAPPDTSNGSGHEGLTDNGFQRPDTASTEASQPEFDPSQRSEAPQQSEFGGPLDSSSHHQQQQPQLNQGAPQQQSQVSGQDFGSGAPSGQEQQIRRQPYSQYKLQAKITGLERTGRKDPILRFDVHVSSTSRQRRKGVGANTVPRQIYPDSELPNSAMSAACIPSSSSLPST